jgi:hypothetical protein
MKTGRLAKWLMSLGAVAGVLVGSILMRRLANSDTASLDYLHSAVLAALLGSTVGALASLSVGTPLSADVLPLFCATGGAFLPYPAMLWLVVVHRYTPDNVLVGTVLLFCYAAPFLGAILGLFGARRLHGFGPRAARFAGAGLAIGLVAGGVFLRVMQASPSFPWEDKTFFWFTTLTAAALGPATCGAVLGSEASPGRGFRLDNVAER